MDVAASTPKSWLRNLRARYEGWRFRSLQGDRETPLARSRRDHFAREGLRLLRETWWLTFRYETSATIWRYLRLLESTPEPDAHGRPVPERAVCAVYSPGHIGDILQTLPLMRALRNERPLWRLVWMVGPWSQDLATAANVAHEVITYGPAWSQYHRGRSLGTRGWREEAAWLRRLAERRVDIFVSTAATDLATLAVGRALRPRVWCGIEPGLPLYQVAPQQHLLAYQRDLPEASFLLGLGRPLGVKSTDAALRFDLRAGDQQAAQDLLQARAGRDLVALAPGGGWPGKLWPAESFRELAHRLLKRDVDLLLVGSAGERNLASSILDGLDRDRVLDLSGQTPLPVLAAVLARCALLVCNDSGPLHVAAAVGTPTVSLFGPTRPQKWAPCGHGHTAIRAVEHCPDCCPWHPRARCAHDRACMRAIGVDEVATAVGRALDEARKAPAAASA